MKNKPATSHLDRLLEPLARCLSVPVAHRLVKLKVDSRTQARLDALADKCTEGALSPAERSEYETYVRALDLIAAIQAKARRIVGKRSSPAA